jgi:hypothetical protein
MIPAAVLAFCAVVLSVGTGFLLFSFGVYWLARGIDVLRQDEGMGEDDDEEDAPPRTTPPQPDHAEADWWKPHGWRHGEN